MKDLSFKLRREEAFACAKDMVIIMETKSFFKGRKIIFAIIAAVLVASAMMLFISPTVFAEKIGMYYVKNVDEQYYIVGIDGSEPDELELPEKLNNKTVAGVKNGAFKNSKATWFVVPKAYSVFETTSFGSRQDNFFIYMAGRGDLEDAQYVEENWENNGEVFWGNVFPDIDELRQSLTTENGDNDDGFGSYGIGDNNGLDFSGVNGNGQGSNSTASDGKGNRYNPDDDKSVDGGDKPTQGGNETPDEKIEGATPTPAPHIMSIKIVTPPNKTSYIENERFSTVGMVIKACYSDDTEKEVRTLIYDTALLKVGTSSLRVTYMENNKPYSATQKIEVTKRYPVSLKITIAPRKVSYVEKMKFSPDGVQTVVTYNNGEKQKVIPTCDTTTSLPIGKTSVVFSYVETGSESVTAEQLIEVLSKEAVRLELKTPPLKHSYYEGESFASAGISLTVIYNNADTLVIDSDKIFFSSDAFVYGTDTSIRVGYKEKNIYVYCNVPLGIKPKYPTKLRVVQPPNKTSYVEEMLFIPTGMVTEATFNNGDVELVSAKYVNSALVYGQTGIKFTYEASEHEVSVLQPITVARKTPTALIIKQPPAQTEYNEGYKFKPAGMSVSVSYDNGKSAVVTAYTYQTAQLTEGQSSVTVSYRENNKTVTVAQPVSVGPLLAIFEKWTAYTFTCTPCNGKGKISSSYRCGVCGGDGSRTWYECSQGCVWSDYSNNSCSHGGVTSSSSSCGSCGGQGSVQTSTKCKDCSGVGTEKRKVTYLCDVTMPKKTLPSNGIFTDGNWYVLTQTLGD